MYHLRDLASITFSRLVIGSHTSMPNTCLTWHFSDWEHRLIHLVWKNGKALADTPGVYAFLLQNWGYENTKCVLGKNLNISWAGETWVVECSVFRWDDRNSYGRIRITLQSSLTLGPTCQLVQDYQQDDIGVSFCAVFHLHCRKWTHVYCGPLSETAPKILLVLYDPSLRWSGSHSDTDVTILMQNYAFLMWE